MSAHITFDVAGDPVPQGSTRAFSRGGKVHTTNDPTGRIERWRGDVRWAARAVLPTGWEPLTGPIGASVLFRIRRPKSHFLPANSKRSEPVLRPDAPRWCDKEPDIDKLLRAVFDALSLLVYVDDAQIVHLGTSSMIWSTLPSATIDVAEILP